MPEIPLRRVLSVSSEDPRFPASNLLQPDEGGRWLSAKAGEKQISVVLELAEPKPIHSLHIGNCGSAFVEVLVGLAGGDYEVLVPTAAFLSPNESRMGAEPKRVRLFGAQSLVKGVAVKSWERLRLVCSQPYCQTRPFGLSFVRVFSPPEDKEPSVRHLGPFTLREEGGSPLRPPGSLFYRRPSSPTGPSQTSPGPSYAAAALQSSPKAPKRRPPTPKANGTPPSKQPAHSPTPNASSPAPKVANSTPKASSSAQKSPNPTLKAPGSTHKALSSNHKAPGSTHKAPSSSPKGSNSIPKASTPTSKGLSSSPKGSIPAPKGSGPAPMLGGVVFALSGFENPLRSQLREAALGLGATYSPDWTEACTHLVSAFPRTPKVARARALGGVVVGPSWIWDCQKRQQRLPCGPYLLGGSGSASSDTEEEEEEEHASAPPPVRSSTAPKTMPPSPEPAPAESPPPILDPPLSESGDGGNQLDGEDPYGGSTEENSEEEEEDIPPLPNFFEDKTFFLHGDFPPGQGRLLLRYLMAFGGTLAPYMDDSVTHVVTAQDWNPAFEEALELRPSLTFVRPRWLLLCGQQQRPLPAQPFAVVPNH